jgi:hypothetical protein
MKKCSWTLGTPCSGQIKQTQLFSRGALAAGVTVNICAGHLEEHETIIALHRAGYTALELLNKSADERKRMLESLNVQD